MPDDKPKQMTPEERARFAADIRSRSKPTDVDSTDLIRKDRDVGNDQAEPEPSEDPKG